MGNLIKNMYIFNLKRKVIFLIYTFFRKLGVLSCGALILHSEQQGKHIEEPISVPEITM